MNRSESECSYGGKYMTRKIKVGIVGYGNLGRGAELGIYEQADMELVAVFTRREPSELTPIHPQTPVLPIEEAENYVDHIDVMLLCGSSKSDLRDQSVQFVRSFNIVDSFDIHEEIPAYFQEVNDVAKDYGYVSIISIGWDPGLFSIQRMIGGAIFPRGEVHTFWGEGLSQGHSAAIRKVAGVRDGVQYTIPSELAIQHIRLGKKLNLLENERHERVCYVVAKEGANRMEIEYEIKTMPHYFAPFKTTVHFITEEEMRREHRHKQHGGHVISSDVTGESHKQLMEFTLTLKSNPEFTALVLLAYARAAYRLHKNGESGARTIFDIPPKLISSDLPAELRRKLL